MSIAALILSLPLSPTLISLDFSGRIADWAFHPYCQLIQYAKYIKLDISNVNGPLINKMLIIESGDKWI